MRVVVLGAGAVGGVVGACLAEAGHDVTLVARGAHLDVLRRDGLRMVTPERTVTVRPVVVARPADLDPAGTDVVLLAVKSQDTAAALDDLAAVATLDTPVVCLQNGVDNERSALRLFRRVYGIAVMCPTAFVEPGRVIAYAAPTTGILDVGRYPHGVDDVCAAVAAALRGATFASEGRPDIMRWKYRKLIVNTGNAVEALAGPSARAGPAGRLATDEAERVLADVGIAVVTPEEDAARRRDLIHRRPVEGTERPGGSMWQSLARRAASVETDHLNGEIVRLARHGGAHAPVNERLQQLCRRAVVEGWRAGAMEGDELLADLRAATAGT